MAQYQKKILKISKGQIAPELIERTDINLLDSSAQDLSNFINSKYGLLRSVQGTDIKYDFGLNKSVRLFKLNLEDGTDVVLSINATDDQLRMHNSDGTELTTVPASGLGLFSAATLNRVRLAQSNDLIVLSIPNSPMYELQINPTGTVIALSLFNIPAENIIKTSTLSTAVINHVFFRITSGVLPTDPGDLGMTVGDWIQLSATGTPPTAPAGSDTWQLLSAPDENRWTITGATINAPGAGYTDADILTDPNSGATFTYNSGPGTLTINNPTAQYDSDPAGTNITLTGGTGTGMTADITSQTILASWLFPGNYSPSDGDYCKNQDGVTYIYNTGAWTVVDDTVTDQQYNTQYRVTRVAGTTSAILDGFITVTKPAGYTGTPQQYAEKRVIGTDFDGLEGLGVMRITKIIGTTSGDNYQITQISGSTTIPFDQEAVWYPAFIIKYSMQPAFDAAPPGSEENLNSTTNYPLYIFFYQQRLWIAGTENDPTQLIASRLGMYDDFSDDFSGAETNAFQLRIAGTEKETIQTVLLNQGIQIYTDKGEWILSDTAITRDSGFVRNSTIGSGPVQAVISGGGTSLFVPQNGLGLIALTYSLDFSSYQTPYVSFLTNAIDSPIIDMCLKKGFTSTDDTLIFLTLQNGKVVIANYLTDQQIQSFVVRVSGDSVYQQCIQPGSSVLYLINRNGSIVIEEQNDNRNTEASFDSFSYNPGTGVISSLPDAYNGISINVYDGDGVFAEFIPASGNQATLTTPVPAVSEVGLDINSRMESNPQNIGPETFDKYKTIRSIKVALTENSDGTYMKINGKSPSRTKGKLLTFIRPGRPERESVFTIINDVYKVEIMSIEIELEA